MASVKKIETTVGEVRVVTASDGNCTVCQVLSNGSTLDVVVDEENLIVAVLEYAHERGLRRMRKTPTATAAKPRKTRKVKQIVPREHPGSAPTLSDPLAGTPAAFGDA